MNNPQFYIFGVPDGFDMYNATPEKEKLFQKMYDDLCRDNRRMVIHRNADNSEVTYIYLRYNMRSYSNRPASFLGLALTFSGGCYCKDISLLLNLFEIIYKGLSSDVVLSTRIPSGQGQGRYLVRRFAERTDKIIMTEEFVESQTRGWFGQSVVPMDETFIHDTHGMIMKNGLFLDTKPEHIIANMKTASWVYLSDRKPNSNPSPVNVPSSQSSEQPPVVDTQQLGSRQQHPVVNPPSSHKTPQQQPKQVEKPADLDGERQRQLAELKRIKVDFERERESYYKYNSKKKLYDKQRTFEVLRGRINALSIRDTQDGYQQESLIAEEIGIISDRIYQIEQSEKTKRWVFSGVGVALLVAFLVFFFPKKESPTPPGVDYGWNEYYKELTDSIERINTSISFWTDSISTYSSKYSTNNDYKCAENYLTEAIKNKESANDWLLDFDTVLEKDSISVDDAVDVIKEYVGASRKALSDCEKAWNQFKEGLKKQETPKKEKVEAKAKQVEKKNKDSQAVPSTPASTSPVKWNIQVTGNPNPQVKPDGINTWHVKSGTNNPVIIKVTNNNKPVDVVWTWNDATVSIISKNIQSGKTECRSIKVALRGGKTKGKVQFKLKGEEEFKYTVWLEQN